MACSMSSFIKFNLKVLMNSLGKAESKQVSGKKVNWQFRDNSPKVCLKVNLKVTQNIKKFNQDYIQRKNKNKKKIQDCSALVENMHQSKE